MRRPQTSKKPKLPDFLERKLSKTGQTRGSDDDQIYQNRVARNSTVLIPLAVWCKFPGLRRYNFENKYIVLVSPAEYFGNDSIKEFNEKSLELGVNALIFYERREDWTRWKPTQYQFLKANSRGAPLGGQYVARIANTTSTRDARINEGFTDTGLKGAGIRLFEYASQQVIRQSRQQLEAIFWSCRDAIPVMLEAGMSEDAAMARAAYATEIAQAAGLLAYRRLQENRILNHDRHATCPLCLEPLSARGFLNRLAQAEGRERHDLTVTEINLFHIEELAYGLFNHKPYNLGWGHHHCNVVCKDAGITETLRWMNSIIERNSQIQTEKRGSTSLSLDL